MPANVILIQLGHFKCGQVDCAIQRLTYLQLDQVSERAEMNEQWLGAWHRRAHPILVEGVAKMVKFCSQLMQTWGTKEMVYKERSNPT